MHQAYSSTLSSLLSKGAVLSVMGFGLFSASAELTKLQLATLQEEVARLSRENTNLKESLIASNQREEQVVKTLSRIKTRMGALGKSLLTEDRDQSLLSAHAEIEYLQKRVQTLQTTTTNLADSYRQFTKTVLTSDPDAQSKAEASLRAAEVALGFRFKPDRPISTGTLQQAKVISIDQESGLVVLNVGDQKDARIGMRFVINRGSSKIATGIVAETRQDVSGLLIQSLEENDLNVQLGDSARVIFN